MIAFDSDVVTRILAGDPRFVSRAALIDAREHAVPVVVMEEVLRGRLNAVRQAEAHRGRLGLPDAYRLFSEAVKDFQRLAILPYSDEAESLFRQWRAERVRVPTHDLRIAAICVAYPATLVSRNRRDFDQVPGLSVEYWD